MKGSRIEAQQGTLRRFKYWLGTEPVRVHNPVSLAWVYLCLITLAEMITALVGARVGLVIHALLLYVLLWHSALAGNRAGSRLLLVLILAPLIRILSLSMPLLRLPQMFWSPIVALPLLLSAFGVMQQLNFKRVEVGLHRGKLLQQILIIPFGLLMGVLQFAILQPEPLVDELSLGAIWLPALLLLIFSGFSQELIFRGVLQRAASEALGDRTLLYGSALFAVLHIGHLSFLQFVVAFLVGWIFAWLVQATGSLLGVTLAHGLSNTVLYLILPFTLLPEHAYLREVIASLLAVCGLAFIGLCVVLYLQRTWLRPGSAASLAEG